jgi:homoserine O-acetyltransferase
MDLKFGRKFQEEDSKLSGEVDYEVENYLQYKGEKFSDSFDANSYILMTKAMDNYDASVNGNLEVAMSKISCRLLIIGFETDWLYPPERGKEIQLAGMKTNVNCTYVSLPGEQGHDSFLFASDEYDEIIKSFIESK